MSPHEEHRRVYEDEQNIPLWLKWVFVSINRVGFPIVAFILMWYMCQISIAKVIAAVEQNTVVLVQIQTVLAHMKT